MVTPSRFRSVGILANPQFSFSVPAISFLTSHNEKHTVCFSRSICHRFLLKNKKIWSHQFLIHKIRCWIDVIVLFEFGNSSHGNDKHSGSSLPANVYFCSLSFSWFDEFFTFRIYFFTFFNLRSYLIIGYVWLPVFLQFNLIPAMFLSLLHTCVCVCV